jgi:hypothetical protein
MQISIQEAALLYLEVLKQQGKSPRTLYTYHQDLKQVCGFFGAEKLITSITFPLVGKFLKSEILLKLPNGKSRATATVNKTIRVFRMFLIWAKGEGYLETLPLTKEIPLGRNINREAGLSGSVKVHLRDHCQVTKFERHKSPAF